MSLQHLANHVAEKGRHGDSTLVHVSKGELAGLQALAKNNGTTLTINPHTGLPEAFNLGKLLPLAAGVAMASMGVPPVLAGGLMGLGTYAATGSLQQGLMAGLGAYGGSTLGAGMNFAGTAPVAGEVTANAVSDAAATAIPPPVAPVTQAPLAALPDATAASNAYDFGNASNAISPSGMPSTVYDISPPPNAISPNGMPSTTYDFQPAPNAISPNGAPSTVYDIRPAPTNSEIFMNNVKANPYTAVGAAASALMPEPKKYEPPVIKRDTDMGQRYGFESGYDPSIPGRTSQPSYTQISNEEAKKRYGFAEGGSTGSTASGYGAYTAQDANVAARGLGTGIDYSGYDTAPNKGIVAALPKGNPNQNIVELYKKVEADKKAKEAADKVTADAAAASSPSYDPNSYGGGMAAGGGISTLGGYSDGGRLLKGPGDGMSDNIPAQIGRKQPARLADGEFVVPADVVSHLGNGSTDAGAKQLYKMMDKIRQARTGRKAQGKQINPNKFMPA